MQEALQTFDAGYPTTGKTTLCSTDFKRERWAWMLTQPVQPPRFYAGLDMAKNDQWDGLKIEDAEQPPASGNPTDPTGGLCQSNALGFEGTCPSGFGGCNGNTWGNNSEVFFSWNVATHLVDQMVLGLGYVGPIQTIAYPDHQGDLHSYTITIGDVVRRGDGSGGTGEPFLIQWQDTKTKRQQITDMFNATMATFALKAGVPFDTSDCTSDDQCNAPGTVSACQCAKDPADTTGKKCLANKPGKCGVKNCGTDGNCLVYNDGSSTIFGFRPLVVYIEGNDGQPQPAESTPTGIYNFFSKFEPFSNLPQEVKLDAEGPVASGTPVGVPIGSTTFCKQAIGQSFADFRKNCVQVHGDASDPNGIDTVNLNKVTHSLTHDQEHWTANVLGVNQNFTSGKTQNDPTAVVLDTDQPQDGDIAEDWTFDSRARGAVKNDNNATEGTHERGSSLIGIEWARLMLQAVADARNAGRPAGAAPLPVMQLGDPNCVGFDGNGQPNYKSHIDSVTGLSLCSGVEGLIIPGGTAATPTDANGNSDFSNDPGAGAFPTANLNPVNNFDYGYFYASFLKPGDVNGAVCIDPGAFTDCTLDSVSIWQNLLKHVTRVLGGGDVNKLPLEMRDRRFYYRTFGQAFVKYLKAYGAHDPSTRGLYPAATGGGVAPSEVANVDMDMESFFFDYNAAPGAGGAQTFDKFEYIDRDFIGTGVGPNNKIPWDFEYGCDIFGGNQRYDNWYRRMDREEYALFETMIDDESKAAGQVNNVNITDLFGSTLLGGDPTANVTGLWASYKCAIGQYSDPAAGDPTDSDGVDCTGAANSHPPLDPNTTATKCSSDADCGGGQHCAGGATYENGSISVCGNSCDYTTYTDTGCPAGQACLAAGSNNACVDMKMDHNARTSKYSHPLLWYYPAAWSRSVFSRGHSPVTIAPSDKRPGDGVAMVHMPNFAAGPFTFSPVAANGSTTCATGFSLSADGAFCQAAVSTTTPEYAALVPFQDVQPAIGFQIPIDGSHVQWVSTAQLDFTGVLETYIVDYVPNYDTGKSSCVADGKCNAGFTCDTASDKCVGTDNTIKIEAIEGSDFLGDAFLCSDPATGDILHVHMYDSLLTIVDWLAQHPGTSEYSSAQQACQIIVGRSNNDLYINFVSSKTAGVTVLDGGGQGQGRVTDITLFDPSLIQGL